MKLRDLLPDADIDARFAAVDVTGVTSDSRKVEPGFVFVAVSGTKADGATFAAKAAGAGAAAIVAEHRPDGLPGTIAFIAVANARNALSIAASSISA